MTNPSMVVRVAASLDALRAELKAGEFHIEASTAKMVTFANSFSGTRTVQQAHDVVKAIGLVGGATMLTAKEQANANRILEEGIAKYAAMGREAPAQMRALAESTRAAEQQTSAFSGSFGRLLAAFSTANLIDRGVSSIISWGQEAYKSAAAIGDLATKTGLSTDTIQRMAFVADQTGSSVEAFTKAALMLGVGISGGKESVRGAVQELGLSFAALKAMGPDAQFDAIAAALGRVEPPQERNRIALELYGKAGAEILPAIAQGYTDIAAKATLMSKDTVRAADQFDDAISSSATFMKALIAETAAFSAEPFVAVARALGLLSGDADAAAAAAKRNAAAAQEAGSTYTDWAGKLSIAQKELAGLSAAKIRQIELAQQLGASTEQLTHDFEINADTLKLLAERHRDAASASAEQLKAIQKTMGEASKAYTEEAKAKDAAAKADMDAVKRRHASNLEAEAKMLQEASAMEVRAQQQRLDAAAAANKALIDEEEALFQATQKTVAAHKDAGAAAVSAAGSAQQAYAGVTTQVTMTGDAVKAYIELLRYSAEVNAIYKENSLFTSLSQYQRIAALKPPGRASGGPVTAGMPYTVGERGPEMFVPERSGTIVPNGAGGATNVTVHVHVDGSVLSTPAQLSDVVRGALLNIYRSGAVPMPSYG